MSNEAPKNTDVNLINADTSIENLERLFKNLGVSTRNKISRDIKDAFRSPDILQYLASNQADSLATVSQKLMSVIQKRLKAIEDEFNKMVKRNEMIEEILLNVLLAIRQNEYLQAYYPAQHGYPAMKVAGSHPIQKKTKAYDETCSPRDTNSPEAP